jgi:hypothetical protein
MASARVTTHGLSSRAEYGVWKNMVARCARHPNYRGRGIAISPEWRHDFPRFLADMGSRPGPEYSIDRIDNDGPYSATNCRWALFHAQCRNRGNNRWITHRGKRMILDDWCRELGLRRKMVEHRLRAGWTIHDALEKPPRRNVTVHP